MRKELYVFFIELLLEYKPHIKLKLYFSVLDSFSSIIFCILLNFLWSSGSQHIFFYVFFFYFKPFFYVDIFSTNVLSWSSNRKHESKIKILFVCLCMCCVPSLLPSTPGVDPAPCDPAWDKAGRGNGWLLRWKQRKTHWSLLITAGDLWVFILLVVGPKSSSCISRRSRVRAPAVIIHYWGSFHLWQAADVNISPSAGAHVHPEALWEEWLINILSGEAGRGGIYLQGLPLFLKCPRAFNYSHSILFSHFCLTPS